MENKIAEKIADLREEEVLKLVKEELDAGTDPVQILNACQKGMVVVGERFEEGIYFISDLILAGEIFRQVNEDLLPKLTTASEAKGGKVVFGTVKDDIHDIGKDLVIGMLRSANFDVTDLGVDVAPDRFVEEVQKTGAKVVGLSGLLTVAFDSMRATVEAFDAAGLRSKVKIMVGGGPVTERVCEYAGADGWGDDAVRAVNLCMQWTEG